MLPAADNYKAMTHICRPHDVKDVVHDLESKAHVVTVFLSRGGHLRAAEKSGKIGTVD